MAIYYHYTGREGYEGILATGAIRPSLKDRGANQPGDAGLGEGIYVTTIVPAEVSRARFDQIAMYEIQYELFSLTESEGKLDYFFELNLPEERITGFLNLYLELGIELQELNPSEIRRVYLYKTSSNLDIGYSPHGRTIDR